jgi:hypothetical protein
MMKKAFPIILILFVLMISSNLFGVNSNKVPKWYPATWTYSSWEMMEFNATYNRFLNTYHLSDIKVGFDTLSAHMKYMQIDDNFLLCDFTNAADSVEEFRSKILDFYHDWWRLFYHKRFVIDSSRISRNDGGSVGGRFYVKNIYGQLLNHPRRQIISLKAGVDKNGRLFYLRSSLVPQLRIPDHPLISETEAMDIIEGYEFTIDAPLFYYSKTVTLTRESLSEPELSIYVQRTTQDKVECLKYRLAWRFKCQDANVYVDAMTGEIIGHKITIIFF